MVIGQLETGRARGRGKAVQEIPKREIWEAFKRVKANQGAAGVDGQSIAGSSRPTLRATSTNSGTGCRREATFLRRCCGRIPEGDWWDADRWAFRRLPTASLEEVAPTLPGADPGAGVATNSYGYRPGKSAIDAVHQARQRCWRYDWVLDLDVQAYFDSIDWELLLKAVRHHTDCPWVLLYIERWLKAPMQMEDGSVVPRMSGTPQGGVISPTLANLFLHYAFDIGW